MLARRRGADVVVMAAAVADYTPAAGRRRRLQKSDGTLTLTLKRTPDILADLGAAALATATGRCWSGFAAETGDVVRGRAQKRERKHVDLIVANDVSRPDAGFDVETNAVVMISAGEEVETPVHAQKRSGVADPRQGRTVARVARARAIKLNPVPS